ncbi:MAG: chromosome segregation protein SMC [Deltaproteobacteria bacterium]|nr:MAG: chromosome segregation protein SMC [Deltaproteobacteria bacterium]
MIKEIRIKNFKSIQKLKLDIGRLTVLIGENGSGKTNVLEALALCSAAADRKLDNEFLASRGIRVPEPEFMRAAFDKENISQEITITFRGDDDNRFGCVLQNDNGPFSKWIVKTDELANMIAQSIIGQFERIGIDKPYLNDLIEKEETVFKEIIQQQVEKLRDTTRNLNLHEFLIYSPENFSLRVFEKEGQIEPLGINGEGLFKLLKVLSMDENIEKLNIIKEKLRCINWFRDFDIPDKSEMEKLIRIKDKYLDETFDQKSSNEGFLFLLFYFALFVSDDTPDFFAIDNIDASLNPKLCSHLIEELTGLAKKFGKQAILTTHNPAILDGLNLDDPEQKLFVVFRNKLGYSKTRQILKPETPEGEEPVRMSEAFLRGYLGGLPKGF